MDIFALFCDAAVAAGVANTGVLTDATAFGGGVAGTYPTPNSYDTGATGVPLPAGPGGTIGGPFLHDIGRGEPRLRFFNQIETAVTSAGAATVEVDFITSATQDLGTPTTLLKSAAIGKAALLVGYRFRHGAIPGSGLLQFIGGQVVIGTATVTAGALTSALVLDADDHADILG